MPSLDHWGTRPPPFVAEGMESPEFEIAVSPEDEPGHLPEVRSIDEKANRLLFAAGGSPREHTNWPC
jgi:hypothetical protein